MPGVVVPPGLVEGCSPLTSCVCLVSCRCYGPGSSSCLLRRPLDKVGGCVGDDVDLVRSCLLRPLTVLDDVQFSDGHRMESWRRHGQGFLIVRAAVRVAAYVPLSKVHI